MLFIPGLCSALWRQKCMVCFVHVNKGSLEYTIFSLTISLMKHDCGPLRRIVSDPDHIRSNDSFSSPLTLSCKSHYKQLDWR